MILLTEEEIAGIISPMLMVSPATIAKAKLKKVANHIRDLPTDGHDKWYYYHQDLAEVIEKECDD